MAQCWGVAAVTGWRSPGELRGRHCTPVPGNFGNPGRETMDTS